MSNSTKLWTVVGVVLLVVIVGWVWFTSHSQPTPAPEPVQKPSPAQEQTAPQPMPAPQQPANDAGMSAPSDTSDAALKQDLNSVDNQMNNLGTDVTNGDPNATTTVQ